MNFTKKVLLRQYEAVKSSKINDSLHSIRAYEMLNDVLDKSDRLIEHMNNDKTLKPEVTLFIDSMQCAAKCIMAALENRSESNSKLINEIQKELDNE